MPRKNPDNGGRLDRIEAALERAGELQSDAWKAIGGLSGQIYSLASDIEKLATVASATAHVVATHDKNIEDLKALERQGVEDLRALHHEDFEELKALHRDTEEKLNMLIQTVDRMIRNGKQG